MLDETEMTLADLLLHLRQRSLDARAKKDMKSLSTLFAAISVIQDAADSFYTNQEGEFPVIGILTELECAIRDSLQGEDWKSTVPTFEQIKASLS